MFHALQTKQRLQSYNKSTLVRHIAKQECSYYTIKYPAYSPILQKTLTNQQVWQKLLYPQKLPSTQDQQSNYHM